jgi:hypothetical protein
VELTPPRLSKSARGSLSKTQSYREFLQIYFAETELSYAEVARRAGFSSRSYPRDVTENRRRLTAKALPSLMRGLRLDASLSRLFQALYFREFPEEHVGQLSRSAINAWITKERKRSVSGPIRLDLNMNQVLHSASKPAHIAGAFTEVIAALGEPGTGATLEEIHQRTGRSKEELALILSSLEKDQVIDYSANACRYLPKSGHINLTGFPRSELARTVFQAAVQKLDHVANRHFSHEDALFMTSAISVKKSELPRLKKEMRELILKFIDRNVENTDSPDTVVHLVNAIFEAPLTRS